MYWTALVLGFLGNFHCIGMCGPIALSLPVGKLGKRQRFFSILQYNLGRLLAYGVIGAIIGVFGLGLRYIGIVQLLSVFSGVVLFFIGLFSLPQLKFKMIEAPRVFVQWVQQKISYYMKNRSRVTLFFVGFFNGFLPCGLVYAGLVGSLVADSWWGGVLYMLIFGVGTLPLMVALPYISGSITPRIRSKMRKVVPYSIMFFGVLFIIRGANLGIPYLSPKIDINTSTVTEEPMTPPVMYCH